MAQQKTWTAYDITKNQQITIYQLGGGLLRFSQDYQFLDSDNKIIESQGYRHTDVEVNFATLPQMVQDALTGIQDYLYQTALQIEEMED